MGEDSASIIRKLFEAFSAKDYDTIEGLVTDDFELIDVASGEKYRGPEGARRNAEGWLIPTCNPCARFIRRTVFSMPRSSSKPKTTTKAKRAICLSAS